LEECEYSRTEGHVGYVADWALFVHAQERSACRSVADQDGKRGTVLTENQLRTIAARTRFVDPFEPANDRLG
jgi:hypothetical protein